MDYFFRTRPKDWTFEFALLYYAKKSNGNMLVAAQSMKNDLQTMISSELVAKKATDIMRGYHANFDKLMKITQSRNSSSSSTSAAINNQIAHTNVVVGTQNITTNSNNNNNNNNSSSSSSSSSSSNNSNSNNSSNSRKRKQPYQSDSDNDDSNEDDKSEDDISDGERRKSADKLDFLVGGEPRITIEEHDNAWIVNNTNISKNFHIFRNRCMDMLERGRVCINHTQELALNGIMWFDDKNRRYYNLNAEQWAVVQKEVSQKYPRAESVDFSEIAKIADILSDDFDAGERQAELWYCSVVNTNDNNMKLIARTVLDLVQKSRKTNAVKMREPLFCSLLVESIVTPFLCLDEDCLTLLGNTDESLGSKIRRQQDGRRPDLSVLAEFNNQSAMPFICEVKSSEFMNNLKQTDDKHPDFIKLCNLMKDELDRMMVAKEKVVYGLLVEGFKCRLFAMDNDYHKLYRLSMLSLFYLPRDLYDFSSLVPCFKKLYQLKMLMQITTAAILDAFSESDFEEGTWSPNRKPNNALVSFRSPQK